MKAIVCCQRKRGAYFWREWFPSQGVEWHYVDRLSDLDIEGNALAYLKCVDPDVIFFAHWGRKVPPEIHEQWKCVNLHPSDLPNFAGPNPIQAQILAGLTATMVTAHRMTAEYDKGLMLLKRPLSLLGGMEEVYIRHGRVKAKMIHDMARWHNDLDITAFPMGKEGSYNERRTPDMSDLSHPDNTERCMDMEKLFDWIRSLDTEAMPSVFFVAGMKYEIDHPHLVRGADGHLEIEARVKIKQLDSLKGPCYTSDG